MKMRLPNSRRNFGVGKTKTIRTSCAFCFNYPKGKLRQLCFHISGAERRKIEIDDALRLSCELFCHQRPPAGYRSPVDMTLRFAMNVGARSRKIVALSKLRQWPAVVPSHET
jgi:hypothetical protein